jgi:hypothetical protein
MTAEGTANSARIETKESLYLPVLDEMIGSRFVTLEKVDTRG